MKHSIAHDLNPKLATLAAEKAVEAYGKRFEDYDFAAEWVNEKRVELGFTVAGKRLEGSMEVQPKEMALQLVQDRSPLHDADLDVRRLIEAVRQGDVPARAVVARAAERLALAIAGLLNLMNPQTVVLGGELATVGDALLQSAMAASSAAARASAAAASKP